MLELPHADSPEWRRNPQRMHALVEDALELITVVSADLTILYQSRAAQRLLGYDPVALEGTKFAALVEPEALPALRVACAGAADGLAARPVTVRLRRASGGWLEGETLVRHDAAAGHLVLSTRDVGGRNRAARRDRLHAARQALIVELGARALAGVELDQLVVDAAAGLRRVLDANHVAVLRRVHPQSLLVRWAADGEERYGELLEEVHIGQRGQVALALATREPVAVRDWGAEERFAEAPTMAATGLLSSIAVPLAGPGHPFGIILVQSRARGRFGVQQISATQAIANILASARARRQDEERIRHQATHDVSTGLPNRLLFEDRLSRALTSGRRRGRRLAVLFVYVDSFTLVKEGLGHATGDELLSTFADRVRHTLRAEDTLARIGGDEFAVLLPELSGEEDVLHVVRRLSDALRGPLHVAGREILTNAAIGIALSCGRTDYETAETLMRDAHLAMFAAKQREPGSAEFFADHMREAAVRQLELAGDLHQALERDELEVHFQPIVALGDELIVGLEALVRWRHPRYGVLGPGVFLALAENAGLIVALGRFVLRTACRTLRRWQRADRGGPRLSVSVNLGPQQLCAPDLVEDVNAILAETGLKPSCLVLEITEDVLLTQGGVLDRLRALKELGVRLAVDDFGTGYSALTHLRRFPVDIIKLDKAFLDDLHGNAGHAQLIEGVIELTHSLGLATVAEGIETQSQAAALQAMGSEFGQGFYFARPLPARDMEALLVPPAAGPRDLELAVEFGH